jgi:hypothetical protein
MQPTEQAFFPQPSLAELRVREHLPGLTSPECTHAYLQSWSKSESLADEVSTSWMPQRRSCTRAKRPTQVDLPAR